MDDEPGWRILGWDPRRPSNNRYLAAGRLQFTPNRERGVVTTHHHATQVAATLDARREQGLRWTIERKRP